MVMHKLLEQIQDNIDLLADEQSPVGMSLWLELTKLHPADMAQLLSYLDKDDFKTIFVRFEKTQKLAVFTELSDPLKIFSLTCVEEQDRTYLLSHLPLNELTDFLDELSDEELKEYLKLLHRREREAVLSLLQFNPESAGGIMDTNVLSLQEDFTVEKSIQILQRLQPDRDLHQHIFVTDKHNRLVGNIHLEDLVLKHPTTHLSEILRPNLLVITVDEDQEDVAKKMVHYTLSIAPVIGHDGIFLGIISSEELVEIIEQEASEDIYRMSALTPLKENYFETSFFTIFYQRSSILIILLLVQTFSTIIAEYYQALLAGFLIFFQTMLVSTGGNASSQTSAYAIQGLATGEINETTRWRFIKREVLMAILIGSLLGLFSFARIYLTHGNLLGSVAVSLSLSAIVIVSMVLGCIMPLILKRFNIDPAHSAGPILTTLMDVIGLLLYCFISQRIL